MSWSCWVLLPFATLGFLWVLLATHNLLRLASLRVLRELRDLDRALDRAFQPPFM